MATSVPFDPFEALDLPRDASTTTIKAKYRQLARRYHPNRHQGSEESKAALSEQFHSIHQAWKYLIDPEKRRRYLELLRLAEEQNALLSRMADLLAEDDQGDEKANGKSQEHNGYVSSDPDDDDLPHMGLKRRRATLERSMTFKENRGDTVEPTSPQRRNRSHHSRALIFSGAESGDAKTDYFTSRRKKLEKLRRKELMAFERYKNAMVEKFEAELEAERTHELYGRAQWKREYFERAPRETAERMRSLQQYLGAIRAFGQPSPRRRNRSTLTGGQILSTEHIAENGPYLMPDNVTSPSKAKSLHRRGWSSDITGDQTSSDENSSGPASPRPTVSWTWHRRHSRNTSLDAFQLPSITCGEDAPKATSVEHIPFKIVVKRPTGFVERTDNEDSTPESESLPSRPRTPEVDGALPGGFTLVPSHNLSQIFRSDRSRSPSLRRGGAVQAPRRSPSPSPAPAETCNFMIKTVQRPEHRNVPFEHVHVLDYAEKCWFLGVEPDADADPEVLLDRLCRLDRNVSEKFMVKPDTKESFTFRLIYDHREVSKLQHQSFIALSYRRKHHVRKEHGHYTLPLDDEMFQAVWDERLSDSEGVWIDQICIDQESRDETTVSMSAMDMVYRSARLVVVALDDIELEANEGSILENHMDEYARLHRVPANKRFRGKQPPFLDANEDLYNLLRKILRSSWFKRAWCRHEMRLARDHVFLIPCKRPGTGSGMNVVRFTGHCLTHLLALAIEVPFEPDIEVVKPALHAFFRDRSKLGPNDRRLRAHHGNFTTVLAEVFGMDAGGDPKLAAKQRAADAMKDKIGIILNTMECGLALTAEMRDPKMPLTKSECNYMLLTLALAAQDPGALCSVGPPMRLMQAETDTPLSPTASSTWLFEPTNVDAGLNNYRTLNRLPAKAHIDTRVELGEHFVRLDLKFLKEGEVHRGFDDAHSLDVARHFVSVCQRRKLGRNRSRYLISDTAANRHFGSMHDVYLQTLACVFECGPDWVEEVCQRYNVSRWKQDGEAAWNLLVALKNTYGRWPEETWSSQAAGFIMDFVNFLVIRGMPQRQILHREEWRPSWVHTEGGGKILTFIPPGNVRPAVPTALLDPDYVHLARSWLLEQRPSLAEHELQWTLLGKSVIFSDDNALQQLHSVSGIVMQQQKVFGREDPEIQKLVWERSLD